MQNSHQPDLIRRLQGDYLRNPQRYDRWGALGMVLLVEDFRRRRNVTNLPEGSDVESLINRAFPGTFTRPIGTTRKVNPASIRSCFAELMRGFLAEGMDDAVASRTAAAETASRFSISAELVNSFLI